MLSPRTEGDDPWRLLIGAAAAEPFCHAWLRILASRIEGLRRALLLTPDAAGVYRPMTSWPAGDDMADLAAAARTTLQTRELVVEPAPVAGRVVLGYPVELRESLAGALILETDAQSAEQRALTLREVHWASAWLHVMLAQGRDASVDASALAGRKVLESLRAMQGHAGLFETSVALANHVALQFAQARVCVGVNRGDRTRLEAISATAWFERRSQEIVDIENALEEAIDQRCSTVVPAIPGRKSAVTAALSHALGASRSGCVVVLAGASVFGAGAMLVDRPAELPFSHDEVLQLEQIARWAGPVLELTAQGDRWFAGKPARLWQTVVARWRDPRRPALRLGLGLAVVVLAGLTLVPVQRRVTAQAVVEGGRELVVTAPFEGYIGRAVAKAGQTVRVGAVLAEMDRRELQLESDRREAGRAQQERRFIDALSKRDRAAAGVAHAAMDEADAQLALTRYRLERSAVKAEVDAMVIAGDLSQQIGAPVKQGQVLFRLAPLDDYRVILKVDERDIQQVKPGQAGDLVLAGATNEKLRFEVRNIAAAEAADGINTFRVEAQVLGAPPQLRPGMEGVGKVETGHAPLLQVWTRRALQWTRLTWFRLWP